MAVSVVSFQETAWTNITTPKTLTALAWSAGDVIVVAGGIEASDSDLGTPTNANLTFALQASNDTADPDESASYIWTATAATAQTGQTVTCTRTGGSRHWGVAGWVLTGTSGSVANGAGGLTESGFTFTPTAGSAVVYFFGDWNADANSQTLAAGTGTGTERADAGGAQWSWYAGEWVNVTASSTTFGVTSYAGLKVSHVVLEILAGAAVAPADASPPSWKLPGRIGPDGKVFWPSNRFDNNGAVAEVIVDMDADFEAAADLDVDVAAERAVDTDFEAASDFDVDTEAVRDVSSNLNAASDLDVTVEAALEIAANMNTASDFDVTVAVVRDVDVMWPAASDLDVETSTGATIDMDVSFPAASDFDVDVAATVTLDVSFPAASGLELAAGGPVDVDVVMAGASAGNFEPQVDPRRGVYPSRRRRAARR